MAKAAPTLVESDTAPTDNPHEGWLGRHDVANRLRTDISRVRRLEGKRLHPVEVIQNGRMIHLFDPEEVESLIDSEQGVGPAALIASSASLVRQVQEMRTEDQAAMARLLEEGRLDREATRLANKDVISLLVDALKTKDEREKSLQAVNDSLLQDAHANISEVHELQIETMKTESNEKRKNEALATVQQLLPSMIAAYATRHTRGEETPPSTNATPATPTQPETAAQPPVQAASSPPVTEAAKRDILVNALARPGTISTAIEFMSMFDTLTPQELEHVRATINEDDRRVLDSWSEKDTEKAPS